MTSTFTIHRIDCQSCVLMIEEVSEETPGVDRADVDARRHVLTVTHQDTLDLQLLQQRLTDAGYPVSLATKS